MCLLCASLTTSNANKGRYILWCLEKFRAGQSPKDFAHAPPPKKKIRGFVTNSDSLLSANSDLTDGDLKSQSGQAARRLYIILLLHIVSLLHYSCKLYFGVGILVSLPPKDLSFSLAISMEDVYRESDV